MRRTGQLLFLFFAVTIAATGETGIDRPYGDLPNMPKVLPTSANATDCQAECDRRKDCVSWSFNTPANGCPAQKLCWLKASLMPVAQNPCITSSVKGRQLTPLRYMPLSANATKPTGWLLRQLQLQATGLAAHLAEFWPNIARSVWIGGDSHDPGDLDERVPYWLNGLVPNAYQTGDKHITEQVQRYLNYIMDHQAPDGNLGPGRDAWPRVPLLLAMLQYSELEPTATTKVVDSIWRFLKWQRGQLLSPQGEHLNSWGAARWQDLLLYVYWVLDNHPRGQEEFLLNFAEVVYNQRFDWNSFFAGNGSKNGGVDFPKGPCGGGCANLWTHGVNVGQALKSSAVWYRYSQNPTDMMSTIQRAKILDQYHGMASGVHSCSEHLAGLSPSQGAETCTVVETMYSYQFMFAQTGLVRFADRIELLTYNALPASMTPDTWAHVYLQQSNEISSEHADPSVYVSDGADSNIYGLEPNFGCCTVNYPQGWPKFVSHMFMSTRDDGIMAVTYGPATVNTRVGGKTVEIAVTTDYPFADTITFVVKTTGDLPFYMRIPSWATAATYTVNGKSDQATAGTIQKVLAPAGTTTVVLTLPMKFRIVNRPTGGVSVYRGPLLYSLNIGENMKQTKNYYLNSSDYVITPTKPWNFALKVNSRDLESSFKFSYKGSVGPLPFSETGSPVQVSAQGRQINWGVDRHAAVNPPASPVTATTPLVNLQLLPFGAVRLRMTELPTLAA